MNATIFEAYLQKQYQKAGAVTYGEKLAVIDQLIEATKQGQVPISPDQRIKLNPNNPTVQAIREGRPVSLQGETLQPVSQRVADKKEADTQAKKKGVLGLVILLIPLLLLGAFLLVPKADETPQVAVVVTTDPASAPATATYPIPPHPPTTIPTRTPAPTFTPVSIDADTYEIQVSDSDPLANYINPIALDFAGREWRVQTAKLQAEWEPEGVEWWPGTHVRRILAIPYEPELVNQIFNNLKQPITIRLRNGVALQYEIDDVRRVGVYAIEQLLATDPSIALILYGQTGDERWLVTGRPLQEAIRPTTHLETTTTLVTVQQCEAEAFSLTCIVTLPAKQQALLESLTLTDQAWLEQADYTPIRQTTILSEADGVLTLQIRGVVRTEETAVLTAVVENTPLIQPIYQE